MIRNVAVCVLFASIACIQARQIREKSMIKKTDEDKQMRFRQAMEISRGTQFCYQNPPTPQPDSNCWASKPSNAAACTTAPTTNTCRCPGGQELCDVHANEGRSNFEYTYCADKYCYVPENGNSECFCNDQVRVQNWPHRGNRATERCTSSWWRWACCASTSGYTWHNGRCQDKSRFMGEECWDGSECQNGDNDARRVSCYEDNAGYSTCVPAISVDERRQCGCAWFDWYFYFACGSNDCDGHACVLNTGDGNRYCDYNTDQNW